MKLPWKRKKVRISMDDEQLVQFIMNILSKSGTVWKYDSMLQQLIIDRNVSNLNQVRLRILEWLEGK